MGFNSNVMRKTSVVNVDTAKEEKVDVIDLGAPRAERHVLPHNQKPRKLYSYSPNPRLYPVFQANAKSKAPEKGQDKPKRSENNRKNNKRAVKPQSRIAPRRRIETQLRQLTRTPTSTRAGSAPRAWPAPSTRALDTASRAALQLAASRTPTKMDSNNRNSTSPEDCSDGNETHSAPSEFLAEFLSAIMRRQYAEALKYCRLILQYEPNNATARGFFPLLEHKLNAQENGECFVVPTVEAEPRADSSSESASGGRRLASRHQAGEAMEQEADESWNSRSGGSSPTDLELDSSAASPSRSITLSRHTDSGSGSWSSGADTDDNGNPRAASPPPAHTLDDVENDNMSGSGEPMLKEATSLRRLRAQFACSIK